MRPAMRIEHLVDATPMDRLGLPVFMAVRSRGRPVRFHSGKGMSAESARAGALMETLEHCVSEAASTAGPDERSSLAHIRDTWPRGLALADFSPRIGATLTTRARVSAMWCEQLGSDRAVLLPAELVLLPAPRRPGPALFGTSSSGLASGNALGEATLHALLEVLEHDSVAMNLARDESVFVDRLPKPFGDLARRWAGLGVELRVRFLPNALDLPCFEAALYERGAPSSHVLARGRGMHLDRHIALTRSICEAAQSRLAAIFATQAGVDGAAAAAERLGPPPTAAESGRLIDVALATRPCTPFASTPHVPARTVTDALQALMPRLGRAGLGPAFRRRFPVKLGDCESRQLQVVRVVLAGAESANGGPPRLGRRLVSRLQGLA
jgi:ribosomal protein S12 methylthiotransferase accessory factor